MKIIRKWNKGFSLTEVIVSLGILSIIAVGVMQGLSFFRKEAKQVRVDVQTEEFVTSLVETILEGAKEYQVDYSSDTAIDILQGQDLPMAWDINGVRSPVSDCSECLGRYGVVLKPITNHKGLYAATIRITHPELNNGEMIVRQLIGF